jgi:hypothetical protein
VLIVFHWEKKTFAILRRECMSRSGVFYVNVPAHVLARSCEANSSNFYVNVIPDLIRDELCTDVS